MGGWNGVELDEFRNLAYAGHHGLLKPEDAFMEGTLRLAEARMMNPRAKALLSRVWRLESRFLDSERRIDSLELEIVRLVDRAEAMPEDYKTSNPTKENSNIYEHKKKLYLIAAGHDMAGIEERKKYLKLIRRMYSIYWRAKRSEDRVLKGTQHTDPELTPENLEEFLGLTTTYCQIVKFSHFTAAAARFRKSHTDFNTRFINFLEGQRRELENKLKRPRPVNVSSVVRKSKAKRMKHE